MDSSYTFPSGQVLTAEQFFDAAERLANYYPPTYGREPAEDTGAFLAAFNDTFLELLTARPDGTVGYAAAGRKGSRTPRTFDHQRHFRAWFLGCTRTRQIKAKATYGHYRQDYLDPAAPDHEPAEVTRAHAKPLQQLSRVLVCPFCRGRGLIEVLDTLTPLRRGNERQVWYELHWIVKRIDKSELDDLIAFAELLAKGKTLKWPVQRTKGVGAGYAPSLTRTRRNTCLRCELGFDFLFSIISK